ncbi:hypothetical protein SESBI_49125 [Sesbania bispinosa]|nr:hypothetical protein SESBI_49125 [Sesbania bispinosa]
MLAKNQEQDLIITVAQNHGDTLPMDNREALTQRAINVVLEENQVQVDPSILLIENGRDSSLVLGLARGTLDDDLFGSGELKNGRVISLSLGRACGENDVEPNGSCYDELRELMREASSFMGCANGVLQGTDLIGPGEIRIGREFGIQLGRVHGATNAQLIGPGELRSGCEMSLVLGRAHDDTVAESIEPWEIRKIYNSVQTCDGKTGGMIVDLIGSSKYVGENGAGRAVGNGRTGGVVLETLGPSNYMGAKGDGSNMRDRSKFGYFQPMSKRQTETAEGNVESMETCVLAQEVVGCSSENRDNGVGVSSGPCEAINDVLAYAHLCEVPIFDATVPGGVKPIAALQSPKGMRKKRGRPRKKTANQVSNTDFACGLNPIGSLLEMDVASVSEYVWKLGKDLGVKGLNNDEEIVSILQSMESRDRKAAGRNTDTL